VRIAQVAPLFNSVPPARYGGTERIVSYLTEELLNEGHEITLFASGDSNTRARLVPACPSALPLGNGGGLYAHETLKRGYHVAMLEEVARAATSFDIIHFHTDFLQYPLLRRQRMPSLSTLHSRLDIPDLIRVYSEFSEMPVSSVSNAQRKSLPFLNWQGTVHHGIPKHLYTLHEAHGKYLVFLGRISPEKGIEDAIKIAQRAHMNLKIAAKVADDEFFRITVKPFLKDPSVEFIGEVGDHYKNELLGNAYAMLFPILWPEPFGIVMLESMACGTPIIAYNRGSVPEVLEDGLTGFIVDDVEGASVAVKRISTLSRQRCRERFEQLFTASKMAKSYIALYDKIVEET
jgi:glycosyltransferase involved in cell wall biosynthesis